MSECLDGGHIQEDIKADRLFLFDPADTHIDIVFPTAQLRSALRTVKYDLSLLPVIVQQCFMVHTAEELYACCFRILKCQVKAEFKQFLYRSA